jgi:NAD(P)-dependent dehydrogenase (short-subunit alcohol dehydrogenase family)
VLLDEKNAVIYGAGGSVGRAVALAFAREGARVFLAGRTRGSLQPVAQEIAEAGGTTEVAEVDALDEAAVDEHAEAVARAGGGIDVSFNTIGHGDVHGMPLLEMPYEQFTRPIELATRSLFLTTRAAARHMAARGSGVIMTITATTPYQRLPEIGGTGVRFDAMESQCRTWAAELGPLGVRVLWLRTTGLPEALADIPLFPAYGTEGPMSKEELIAWQERKTMLKRLTTLEELGRAATFAASDLASAMTGCAVNITCGAVPG